MNKSGFLSRKGDFKVENRLKDAEIAVEKYGWTWEGKGDRMFLVPPEDDDKRNWCGMWDENGIPHYLPRYSEQEQ